jgi:hypothetical protein
VVPRAVLDAVVKRKIRSLRRASNPRTPIVQPVARRYTDSAITALSNVYTYILFKKYLGKLIVVQIFKKYLGKLIVFLMFKKYPEKLIVVQMFEKYLGKLIVFLMFKKYPEKLIVVQMFKKHHITTRRHNPKDHDMISW